MQEEKSILDGYSICFNEWLFDKKIKNELGLLLIISSLSAERGYCYASNKYLADIFNTREETISRRIKKLEKRGYIITEYKKRGAEIKQRYLRLTKLSTDGCVFRQPTIDENVKENIISNNIISNNINNNKREIYKEKIENEEAILNYNWIDN